MSNWFSCTELEKLALSGLPGTARQIRRLAKAKKWQDKMDNEGARLARPRQQRGGSYEYHISLLPAEAQRSLIARGNMFDAPEVISAKPKTLRFKASPENPKQRAVLNARAAILAQLDSWCLEKSMTRGQGIGFLLRQIAEDMLEEKMVALLIQANNKRAGGNVSRKTLYNWYKAREKGVDALAPKARFCATKAPWLKLFLKHWQLPTKPSVRDAYKAMLTGIPASMPTPSYEQVRRALKRVHNVDLHRGREGPRELKSRQGYVDRDTSDMKPTEMYMADGHTFDAEVAHPLTGKPFRPEITSVVDVATRLVVGWSIGLSESTHVVMDALTRAIANHGVPAIFYTDRGKGYKNEVLDAPLTGLLARVGITKMESLPYNSQARGLVERLHRTIWVRGARTLPTYIGKDMDKETANKVHKLTRRQIQDMGKSSLLLEWSSFMAGCQKMVDAYNEQPHRSLPKDAIDRHTGKRCHRSPQDHWKWWVSQGVEIVRVEGGMQDVTLKPHVLCKTRRGGVSFAGSSYFNRDLEAYHDEEVVVGYDIHDASRVWVCELVRTREEIATGALICEAYLQGNTQRFVPQTVAQKAIVTRAKGQVRRLDIKKRNVLESLDNNSPPIEVKAQPENPSVVLMHDDDVVLAKEALGGKSLSDSQREALQEDLRNPSLRKVFEIEGLDIEALRKIAKGGEAA